MSYFNYSLEDIREIRKATGLRKTALTQQIALKKALDVGCTYKEAVNGVLFCLGAYA